jgi:hypothetical protein
LAIFKQFLYFGKLSVAKLSDIVVFAFTYVSESLAQLLGNFGMKVYRNDGDEALNASSLQFFRNTTLLHRFNI